MLLRGMNPSILACDEVTAPADCNVLAQCGRCGVALLATVHAEGVDDLLGKPLYRGLLHEGLFRWAVYAGRGEGSRVEELRW